MIKNTFWLGGLLACGALVVGAAFAEDKPAASTPAAPALEVGTAVGNKIPHFAVDAHDLGGEEARTVRVDSHDRERPTVYVFMSKSCPWCHLYEARLAEMSHAYAKKGADFVMVYPNRSVTVEQKQEHFRKAKFGGVFLNDEGAAIATKLKITKTPEIVVADKNGEIMFRGGIDDSPQNAEAVERAFLKDAIDATIEGREVETTGAPLYG